MNMSRLAGFGLLSVLCAGCSTIQFQNGPSTQPREISNEWHHIAAFSLMEVSDPVDLTDRCNGKAWDTVTTERTFINGLAGMIDSLIIGVDLWEPWTVEYSCRESKT